MQDHPQASDLLSFLALATFIGAIFVVFAP